MLVWSRQPPRQDIASKRDAIIVRFLATREVKSASLHGAYGYRLDVEAAIAYGKHVKEHHLDKFETLQVKQKKQKSKHAQQVE